MRLPRFAALAGLLVFAAVAAFPLAASASHSWGPYHWGRTSNPFTVKLGDNLSSAWDPYLATTSADWSASTVLDTAVVAGQSSARRCPATSGRVEVCSSTYGRNGWLGVAQIWITGGVHIVQGTVKLNDTYFNTASYNTPAWRNLVMCQEVGHTLGLNHQDEDFNNTPLGTCMDYSSNPVPNQHPNAHDYEQLDAIYAHLDSTTTVGAMPAGMKNGDFGAPNSWGQLVSSSANGRSEVYERDFGGGYRVLTHVFWVDRSER